MSNVRNVRTWQSNGQRVTNTKCYDVARKHVQMNNEQLLEMLAKLDQDQIAELKQVASDKVKQNEQQENEQKEVDNFCNEYGQFIEDVKQRLNTFAESTSYEYINDSVKVFSMKLQKHVDSFPVIDNSVLKSQRISKSGRYSTRSSYLWIVGSPENVSSFRNDPTVDKLQDSDFSIGGSLKGVRVNGNYQMSNGIVNANKVWHSTTDKGVRGCLDTLDNNDRNVDGQRCFPKDISDKLRDKSLGTGMYWTDNDCDRMSDYITTFKSLEDNNVNYAHCLINTNLIKK